jgi:hypothetical protein
MVASLMILIRLLLQGRDCQDQLRFLFGMRQSLRDSGGAKDKLTRALSRDLVPDNCGAQNKQAPGNAVIDLPIRDRA